MCETGPIGELFTSAQNSPNYVSAKQHVKTFS